MISKVWFKPFITLAILGVLLQIAPSESIDPWQLFNPRKIISMIFALTFIQILGSILNQRLASNSSAILTGFLGGLVSSTATTAHLAKNSSINQSITNESNNDIHSKAKSNSNSAILVFLATTLAMLFEALVLVWMGSNSLPLPILIIFSGPILISVVLIVLYSTSHTLDSVEAKSWSFQVLPILKLSLFIMVILLLSKLLQYLFGKQGLMILTFLVSLFEIHGSVISNVQFFENGTFAIKLLTNLLGISIIASYLSKLFLIFTLGNKNLKSKAIKSTTLLFIALALSWVIAINYT